MIMYNQNAGVVEYVQTMPDAERKPSFQLYLILNSRDFDQDALHQPY